MSDKTDCRRGWQAATPGPAPRRRRRSRSGGSPPCRRRASVSTRVRALAVFVLAGVGDLSEAPAPPAIAACNCKWPDLAHPPGQCDSPPKMCGYCTTAMSYMFYGPENSATAGCLMEGRGIDVCELVASAIQANPAYMQHMRKWDAAVGDAGGASVQVCRQAGCCGSAQSFKNWGLTTQ